MENCVFCKIIKGEIPCYKIFEDETTFAFLDIADDFIGHTLVVPKKHYENILDIPSEELKKVMNTVQKISQHYVKNCGYEGVNIVNASGECAEQTVFHLHFHIIPRKSTDSFKIWPQTTKQNQDMKKVCEKLKLEK